MFSRKKENDSLSTGSTQMDLATQWGNIATKSYLQSQSIPRPIQHNPYRTIIHKNPGISST